MITTRNELLNIDFKFFQRHADYVVNYCIKYDINPSEFVSFTNNQKKMLKNYITKAANKLGPIKSSHDVWVAVPVMVRVYNTEDEDEIKEKALDKCSQDFDPSIFPRDVDFQIISIEESP